MPASASYSPAVTIIQSGDQLSEADKDFLIANHQDQWRWLGNENYLIDVNIHKASNEEMPAIYEAMQTGEPKQKIDYEIKECRNDLIYFGVRTAVLTPLLITAASYLIPFAFETTKASPNLSNKIFDFLVSATLITFAVIEADYIKNLVQNSQELTAKRKEEIEFKMTVNEIVLEHMIKEQDNFKNPKPV